MTKTFHERYDEIVKAINNLTEANVIANFINFAPSFQFIRIDALDAKDHPHNISDNSIFLEFEVDFVEDKVTLHRCGHIYLSPTDKASEKYRYLAMKSMVNVHTDMGGKKFRKRKFKGARELAETIVKYYNEVMTSVKTYTNNTYPYKEGVI